MAKNPKTEIIKRPIERMGGNIKQSAWSSALESLAMLILGICFVIWPDVMMQVIAYLIGAILLFKGGFEIMTYFVDERAKYSNLLLSGLVSAFIGLIAVVMGPNIANVFRIVIAIFLIYEALARIASAVKLYQAGLKIWRAMAILALIMLVMGIFVAINDAASVIGWILVVSGVIGLVGDLMFISQIDTMMKILTDAVDDMAGAKP